MHPSVEEMVEMWLEKEKLPNSKGDQVTQMSLKQGNLGSPQRLALSPPTPGWGRSLARGAGCSGLGCHHCPLNPILSKGYILLSALLNHLPKTPKSH